MTLKQMSTFLNGAIKSNMLGDSTAPVAEDMSNYVDFGKALSSLSAADLEDFKQQLAVQIRNYVIERTLERKDFRMFKDSIEYAGALQRILSAGVIATQDSHLLNLVNGTDYTDGHYYGVNIDSKVFTDVDSFKVPYSISDDDFRLAFINASDMMKVMGLIYNAEVNTITAYLNQLQKRILIAMIENCNTNNRKVGLLTKFNDLQNTSYTIDQIYADRKLYAYFADFVKATISKLKMYVQEMNERYNDGTVTTFTPADKIETILISDFASDLFYIGSPVDYNAVALNVTEISCWQTTDDAMLPTLTDVSTITNSSGTIENVIGIIYDVDSCGIENVADKVTSQYIGSEGFTNYYHHLANRYFYDTRLGSVILTLD